MSSIVRVGIAGTGHSTPPRVVTNDALAEIVADAAPDAEFYLAELGARSDYYPVIDWMAANGVQILVNPIVWTYDGPGNGTGPSAAIVDYAVSKGIAWFNTAGEMASTGTAYPSFNGTYLRTSWRDTDNDRWMDFQPSNTRVVDETLTEQGRDVNRRHYTPAEIDEAIASPVTQAILGLARLRKHAAFEGAFSWKQLTGSAIELQWTGKDSNLKLWFDLSGSTPAFSIEITDGTSSRSLTSVSELATI